MLPLTLQQIREIHLLNSRNPALLIVAPENTKSLCGDSEKTLFHFDNQQIKISRKENKKIKINTKKFLVLKALRIGSESTNIVIRL
jgi:hypothetical protein